MNPVVSIFKLVDGEFLIGKTVKDAGRIKLEDPLTVLMTNQGPAFVPVIDSLTDKSKVEFAESSVVYELVPAKAVYDSYMKNVSPILQPPGLVVS